MPGARPAEMRGQPMPGPSVGPKGHGPRALAARHTITLPVPCPAGYSKMPAIRRCWPSSSMTCRPVWSDMPPGQRMTRGHLDRLGHVLAFKHVEPQQRAAGVQDRALGDLELAVAYPDRSGLCFRREFTRPHRARDGPRSGPLGCRVPGGSCERHRSDDTNWSAHIRVCLRTFPWGRTIRAPSPSARRMPLIHTGDSTHHHDQVMTPISFSTTSVISAIPEIEPQRSMGRRAVRGRGSIPVLDILPGYGAGLELCYGRRSPPWAGSRRRFLSGDSSMTSTPGGSAKCSRTGRPSLVSKGGAARRGMCCATTRGGGAGAQAA